jgi:hypothetical protein
VAVSPAVEPDEWEPPEVGTPCPDGPDVVAEPQRNVWAELAKEISTVIENGQPVAVDANNVNNESSANGDVHDNHN